MDVAEGEVAVAGAHTYSSRDRVWSVRSRVRRVRVGESLNISDPMVRHLEGSTGVEG